MKHYITFLIILGTITYVQAESDPQIQLVKSDLKNLFTFKVDRSLIGAKVEMVYANGDVVTVEKLEKRKMIIDFCDVKLGDYTVKISKDGYSKNFTVSKDAVNGVLCEVGP
ncbi:MAG: hypothetical protein AAF843_03685 [Bacteroidota bacterium]